MSKTKRKPKPLKTRRVITADEWEKMKDNATKEAMTVLTEMTLAVPLKVMREHYGWGAKKRLPELAELLAEEFKAMTRHDVDLREYLREANEICGIKIEAKTGRR